jgi:hypothetical protein
MLRKFVTGDFQDEIDELIELSNSPEALKKGIVVNEFDFKLYFVIRKYIDWDTAWVGANHLGPSRHTLIKAMQGGRIYGSNKEIPRITEGVIRASIERLEKAGFLNIHSVNTRDDKRLIFFLPKAVRGQSVKKGNNRGTTDSEQPEESIDFTSDSEEGTTGEQPSTNPRYHIDRNTYTHTIGGEQKENISNKQTKYREIISDYGFDVYSLCRESALDMYKVLEQADVLEEDIRQGIEQAHLKGGKPNSPAYYQNFILSAKQRRLQNNANKAAQQANIGTGIVPRVYESPRNQGNSVSKPKSNHTRMLENIEREIFGRGADDIF